MTFKATPLSFTKLDCFARCGVRFQFKYGNKLPDPNGPAADVGQAWHGIAEEASREADELEISRLLERKAILLEDPVASDLRDVVHRYLDRCGGLPRIPADAANIEHEAELAIRSDGSACDYWAEDALFRGLLDLSWTEADGTIAVVRDWKTSRVIGQVGSQLKLYGLLLAAKHPTVEQVVAELHFVRFAAVRKEVFDADELRLLPDALQHAAATIEDAMAHPKQLAAKVSRDCFFCPYRLQCPAMKLAHPGLDVQTVEQAVEVAQEVLRLQVALESAEAALRAWTQARGHLHLPSGETVGHHESIERSIPDAGAALRALAELGVPPDVLRDSVSVRVTDLERALKKLPDYQGARRGTKKETLERMLSGLKDAGIITTTTTTKFGRRNGAEEEES